MASTNKTQYFELSQYISSDKPTYLVDYNSDMAKIDGGLHTATNNASNAMTSVGNIANLNTTTKADVVSAINEVVGNVTDNSADIVVNSNNITTNTTSIGTLANLSTITKTDLVSATNEVNSKVGNLSNLNTTYKNDVVGSINEVKADINFSNFKQYNISSSDFIKGSNIHIEPFTLYVARTSNNNYAKVYGSFGGYAMTSDTGNTEFILNNTGIPVSESFYVMGVGVSTKLQSINGTDAITYLTRADLEFNTNGSITIKTNITWQTGGYYTIVLHPCLIQTKPFGDNPNV